MTQPKRRPVAAVDIIIEDSDGKILLGRVTERWSEGGEYEWGLPGREIAFGDDLKIAVERNLNEELGLSLVSARAVSVNSNFSFSNHYITIGVVVAVAGAMTNRRPADWTRWEWFGRNEIPERLFPAAKKTLGAYLNGTVSSELAQAEPEP